MISGSPTKYSLRGLLKLTVSGMIGGCVIVHESNMGLAQKSTTYKEDNYCRKA